MEKITKSLLVFFFILWFFLSILYSTNLVATSSEEIPQKRFKMAFILLGKNNAELTSEKISKAEKIRNNFSEIFFVATGGMASMDTSYKLVTMVNDGSLVDENERVLIYKVTKKFYEDNPDDFDFITIFTSFRPSSYQQYHEIVNNNILGIGMSITNLSDVYGTRGKLMGVNHMGDIDMYDPDSLPTYSGLLHETGHQWCCYVGDNFARGANSAKLEIIQQGIHFYVGLESPYETNTPMNAKHWVPNDDGTYREAAYMPVMKRYHPFQLYFMGLLPESDYSKEYNIYDCGIPPEYNFQTARFYKKVSVNYIIAFAGERKELVSEEELKINVSINQSVANISDIENHTKKDQYCDASQKCEINCCKETINKKYEIKRGFLIKFICIFLHPISKENYYSCLSGFS